MTENETFFCWLGETELSILLMCSLVYVTHVEKRKKNEKMFFFNSPVLVLCVVPNRRNDLICC
jgi:hypothetical protein